jgi:hypothetical protein
MTTREMARWWQEPELLFRAKGTRPRGRAPPGKAAGLFVRLAALMALAALAALLVAVLLQGLALLLAGLLARLRLLLLVLLLLLCVRILLVGHGLILWRG